MKPLYYELKILVRSLAAEAGSIRQQELRLPGPSEERSRFYRHRVVDVCRRARTSQLAYGFLRGRAYAALEAKCYESPNREAVWKTVRKFAEIACVEPPTEEMVRAWFKGDLISWRMVNDRLAAE